MSILFKLLIFHCFQGAVDPGATATDIIHRAGQAGTMVVTITEDIIQVEIGLPLHINL